MVYLNGKQILFPQCVNEINEGPQEALEEALQEALKLVESKNSSLSRAEKEMQNLLQIAEPTYSTDNAVAYKKTVPTNALPYAEVKEIGGMTYVGRNLFDANSMSSHFGGSLSHITVSDNGAMIVVAGDPNGDYNSIDFVFEEGVTYCVTYGGTGTLYYVPAAAALTTIESGVPFTVSGNINCLAFGSDGGTYTNLMIVKGNSPAEFTPYSEGGMKHITAIAIESASVNILDLTPAQNECFRDNGDGTYTLTKVSTNGRFSAKLPLFIPSGQHIWCQMEIVATNIEGFSNVPFQCFDAGGAVLDDISFGLVSGKVNSYRVNEDVHYVRMYLQTTHNIGDYVTFRNPMIHYQEAYGGVAKPYSPYFKKHLNIPVEVQALDGWGMGVDATYHNRIVWDVKNGVKQYRQEVGIIDMGDLSYNMRVSNGRNIFGCYNIPNIRGNIAGDLIFPAVAVGYRAVRVNDTWVDGDMAYGSSTVGYTSVDFVNNAYSDAESFRAAMRGRYLVYALETPTITDISSLLPDDNLIEVVEGGTITAVNAGGYDVPTTITYQTKE